jgi:acyl-CoA reductase-like NAD-dependent aldehyde dehydrogenase
MSAAVEISPPLVLPFVDGRFVDPHSDRAVPVINPSNGRQLLAIPAGSDVDVDRAVQAARKAFEDGRWSEAPPSFRKKVLHRFADLIAEHAAQLDALDAGEMGKPVGQLMGSAARAAGCVRFYAEAIDKITGEVYGSDKNDLVLQRRVPRGVVGAITPWNFPVYVALFKIAPALAAGNCCVIKPSEWSSRSAIRLAQLAIEAGVPGGVLNVVPGVGETVGRALGLHNDVDMISFTGSTVVGKLMLQYAGQSNMKVVMTETGGKSPQIVFADGIDLDVAAASIASFLVTNAGQICTVGSRLLVQRSAEAALVDKIQARLQKIVMGDALDPQTTFGPLVSAKQHARVLRYIENASTDGAQLVMGGKPALSQSGGYFVEPTLFRNVAPKSALAQEEVFGPVLSVIAFDDEDEAVRIANDTIYGLAAYVWTASLTTGMRMAKRIRSSVRIHSAAPTGEGAGYAATNEATRQSGIGAEGGVTGMEGYLRRQRVWFSHA